MINNNNNNNNNKEEGVITAKEMRASGFRWTFAPIFGNPQGWLILLLMCIIIIFLLADINFIY
jgi:hypothetical protein